MRISLGAIFRKIIIQFAVLEKTKRLLFITYFIVQIFLEERRALLDNLQSTGENIHVTDDSQISELLLFDVSSNNDASNTCIIHVECCYPIHVSY